MVLNITLKNHITVIFNIFLMTIIEVNRHIMRNAKFGGFFQVIGDDDLAVFFGGDEAEVEYFEVHVIYRSHVSRGNAAPDAPASSFS